MDYESLGIRTLNDLARLPWFELVEGKIVLRPGAGVPGVIDSHTHVGWSYWFSRWIDLHAESEPVFYYDFSTPQDVLFEDKHPTPVEDKEITPELMFILLRTPKRNTTHTARNLVDEMARTGFRAAIVSPIEIPAWSRHATHTIRACAEYPRLFPLAGVHSTAFRKRSVLASMIRQGVKGLKYHPEFQFFPPDRRSSMRLFAECRDLGLPILCHSGSTGAEPLWLQKFSHPLRFRKILENFPDLEFVLAHTGLRYYDICIEYAKEFPQAYVELSGQPVGIIKKIFREVDPDRILFGSDWTFFPLAVSLARTLVALEDFPQLTDRVLWQNAARLWSLDVDQLDRIENEPVTPPLK